MDKQWIIFLEWRTEKGLKGLATEEEYSQFLSEVEQPTEYEKLTREEVADLDETFKDLYVKDKELATFKAIENLLVQGVTITYEELAELVGVSEKTIRRHIKTLEEKGYLQVKNGKHTNTYYYGVNMATNKRVKFKNVCMVEFDSQENNEDVVQEFARMVEPNELEHVTVLNATEIHNRYAAELNKLDMDQEVISNV